jgi:hypothetical protein
MDKKTKKTIYWSMAGFLIFLAAIILLEPSIKNNINDFESCAAAGYTVTESFPRQCTTPDSRVFVEEIYKVCSYDAECGPGYFCEHGVCSKFEPDTKCELDDDCILINIEQRFSCCWAGRCDMLNYSMGKWAAVSKYWFDSGQAENCPSIDNCGPAPMCATRMPEDSFAAKCVNGRCVKVKEIKCGIESCHGLDIVCGPNVPEACTMEYRLGDKCRQLAKCEIAGGKCVFAENAEFDACKACAEKCDAITDPINAFECEAKC